MRTPSPGVLSILGGAPIRARPVIVGDLNGDGFDDYGVLLGDPQDEVDTYTLIVLGGRWESGTLALDDLIGISLRHADGRLGGINAVGSDQHIAAVGDVDADGYDDFVFGASKTYWQGVQSSGLVILVFGAEEFPEELDLTHLATTDQGDGIRRALIVSEEVRLNLGALVDRAGDINGDGFEDFVLSSPFANDAQRALRNGGRVHLVFGHPDPPSEMSIADLGKTIPGFIFRGTFGDDRPGGHPGGDRVGRSVAPAGDVNGDGFDDLLVGAGVSREGLQWRGAVYLIYGGPAIPADFSNSELGDLGVEFLGGRSLGGLGERVATAGDVDGDGLADILASAPVGNPGQEEVFLIYGARDFPRRVVLDGKETLRRFRLRGTVTPGQLSDVTFLGDGLTGVGDLNADGFPDFFCGAPWAYRSDDHEKETGAGYLIWGGPSLPREARDVDVGTDLLPGVAILGPGPMSRFGAPVSPHPGDINGDGQPDFIVVADRNTIRDAQDGQSAIYLFLGGEAFSSEPAIRRVEPVVGSVDGLLEVRILGRGFTGAERVLFDGVASPSVRAVHSAELRAELPPRDLPGRVDVAVETAAGTLVLEDVFEYVERPQFPDLILDPAGPVSSPFRTFAFEFDLPLLAYSKRSFASIALGDVTGDGIDDLVVGQRYNGLAALIPGSADPPQRIAQGTPLYAERVTEILPRSPVTDNSFGFKVDVIGDLDDDGIAELVIQDIPAGSGLPRTTILFGRADWPERLVLEEEIAAGSALEIRFFECFADGIAAPGDLDGDGKPDLVTGNTLCEGALGGLQLYREGLVRGATIFQPTGRITGDPTPIDERGPLVFGQSIAPAGDMNGDGILDLVAGGDHSTGEAHILLGDDWDFSSIPETEFFEVGRGVRVIRKRPRLSRLGDVVSFAGDFNGDGLSDVVVGLPQGMGGLNGEAYVIFGARDLGERNPVIDLEEEAGPWLRIQGEFAEDRTGYVRGIGDFDGDGLDDIGLINVGGDIQTPRAYVVLGRRPGPGTIDLGSLGIDGFAIRGAPGGWLSSGPQGIAGGDFDGDGRGDVALGEFVSESDAPPAIGQGAAGKGRVVIWFGGEPPGPEGRFIRGDANADGATDVSDAVRTLGYLFLGSPAPPCLDAADVDDDGVVAINDPTWLLNHLFLGGPPPPAPFPAAGRDATDDDALDCGGV